MILYLRRFYYSFRKHRTKSVILTIIMLLLFGITKSAAQDLFYQTDFSATSHWSWCGDNWYQLGTSFAGTLQSLTIKCYTNGGYPVWGDTYLQEFSDSGYSNQTNNWRISGSTYANPFQPPSDGPACGPTLSDITFPNLNIPLDSTKYYRLYTYAWAQNVSVIVLGTSSMGFAMYDEFIGGTGVVYYYYTFYPYIISNPPTGPPAVEVTPSYLVFPSTGDTLPIAVTNSGGAPLSITSAPSVIGSNFSDFVVASGTTCIQGASIAPGQSCVVNVTFAPSAPSTGSWEVATLSLYDNASYAPQTVPLSGGGQITGISPNPVLASGSAQTVTITGTNFAAGATINWQNLTESPWTGSVNKPQVVPPNTITASLPFKSDSAIWQIEVVNPGLSPSALNKTSNWYTFQVDGTGSATTSYLDDYPYKNAPPDHLDPYGFVATDECTSYVAWRMNRDAATTDTSNPSFFRTMANGNWWGDAATWGATAYNLGYKFDPSPQVGDIAQWACANKACTEGHVAYVEKVSNSDGSIDVSEYNWGGDDGGIKHQYGVRHIAAGSPPAFPDEFIHISRLSLNPTSLDFGNQTAGTSSSPQTVTVTNSLAQTISLAMVSVGASNAGSGTADFTETDTCDGTSLQSGEHCEITVTFTPTVVGARSAAIALNWGAGPQLVPVKGVGLKYTTTTTLLSSLNPSVSGKPVSFTASVSSSWGTPTGKVKFLNGTTVLQTVTLNSGSAKYTTSKLPAGSNSITAVYGGDSQNNGSTSAPVNQFVIATTTTTLTSSPNPSTYGQSVIFTATVTSSIGAPPDGDTVTFEQGTTVLGTGTLSGGSATFSVSTLGVGTKGIKAVYGGDASFATSTSKSLSQVIAKATSTTTLISSQNPASFGQSVTFTATVAPQFSGTVTGNVKFYDGTTLLKSVAVSGGSAAYTTSKLKSGTHSITATYNGSTSFIGSTSAALTQTVN